jgi:hypothetical protein
MQENVLINFEVDYSQLTTATEQLAKSGKIDPKNIEQFQNAINATSADTKGLIQKFKDVAGASVKMGKTVEDAFGKGITDALDEAGVSTEDFAKALTKANTPAATLKQELLKLTNAISEAKVNGKAFGRQFEEMIDRAGKLKIALQSAQKEIKGVGTGTDSLDHLVGSIGALTAGFEAAQGAAALFGGENKDFEKTLIKLNGVMALSHGIEQISIALSKEGAIARLADAAATGAEVAIQKIYTAVTGQATAATTGFKVALAATGIGLFVVGVMALVSALEDTHDGLNDVNRMIESQTNLVELNNKSIQRNIDLRIAQAKEAGAAESDLIRIRGRGLSQQFDELDSNNKILAKRRDLIQTQVDQARAWGATSDDATEALNLLNDQIEKNNESLADFNNQLRISKSELNGALISENKDRIKKAEEANKKLKELRDKAAREAREARLRDLSDQLAALELSLLAVEKNTQAEIDIKKRIVGKKAQIDLEAEKITANKILFIKAQSLADQLELQKAFNEKATEVQLQGQISTNNAILALLNISSEEKLRLQIENINTSAQLEINAANGNSAKILEIEGKKYSDIRALKLASLKQQQSDSLQAGALDRSIIMTALQRVAADVKLSTGNRIGAIKGIEIQELASLDKEVAANKEAVDQKLISADTYNREVNRLADERIKVELDTNEKIAELNKLSLENKRDVTIKIAEEIANVFAELSSRQTQFDNELIASRRKEIDDLLNAGAISQKEADARNKQLEALEKQARQRAAQREKNAALFQAALAIPKAFLEGLAKGGPPLADIYAALAAVQAALIASRPIPKFFRGKRDNYQGPGEVADMGSEIVERGGRMFLYTKPTQTYLAASDKVYTAAHTRTIMHNTDTNRLTIVKEKQPQFDYNKFAAAIPKGGVVVNIDKDFISESVASGLSKTNYMDRRYSSR